MADAAAGTGENTQHAAREAPPAIKLPGTRRLVLYWIVFAALAYLPNLAPGKSIDPLSLTVFWAFVANTQIVLCDLATLKLGGESLLQQATGSPKAWLSFLCVGAISGLLLDGLGQWLGKLWFYRYWNQEIYAVTFIAGFCAYWLATVEGYTVILAILRHGRPVKAVSRPRPYAPVLFRVLGIGGIALTAASIALIAVHYREAGGYVFDVQKPLSVHLPFAYFLAAFTGVWLALEWIQSALGRQSLIQTLLGGRILPLIALLIASVMCSLFWESVNEGWQFWAYANWPLQKWQLFHVPVAVFLTWPFQYVVFLSLGFLLGRDLWK